MDLYKTGMLVAMVLCVRGIDCIYGPVQDRNASGHVFVCQGDRSIFVFMDLYKTGMLVAMCLCVRGIDCIYGPVQDRNVSGHVFVCQGIDLCIYGPVQDRNVSGHVFVCQGDRSLYVWTCTRQEC